MADNTLNNKRIAKNTAFLYIRMFIVLIVSLYTSRVVLNCLGVSDYGVYNVVSGFVSLFGFISATLSACMQRFYNYELGKNGGVGMQLVYSTGFWVHVIICAVIVILLETLGTWYINNVLVVPENRYFAANIVFQMSVLSFVAVIMQIPYLGAIMAYERMDIYSYVSILDVGLKLVIVILLQYSHSDKLIFYSILITLISIVDLGIYLVYAKTTIKTIRLSSKLNKDTAKQLLSFSGWNLLGTFAFMINGQGLNLLLNSFFGTVVNAARGIAFQVNAALTGFTSNITTAFRPQVVEAYARGEERRVKRLFYTETKVCFSLMLFLITPIILEIDSILKLWLGEVVPHETNIFTTLVLINTLVCTINPIIGQVAFADGRIKRYQIANSFVNILVIPISWLILKIWPIAVTVFIVTIVLSILNQIVCLVEMNRLFSIDLGKYIAKVIMPCILMALCTIGLQYILRGLWPDHFFFRIIIILALDTVLVGLFSLFVLFDREERLFFEDYMMKIVKRIKLFN